MFTELLERKEKKGADQFMFVQLHLHDNRILYLSAGGKTKFHKERI
jgi:hypothetical protein